MMVLAGCSTTPSSSAITSINMPSIQQTNEGHEFLELPFPSTNHGTQVARFDTSEPYGNYPGSRQWKGLVLGDPDSYATLTQLKTRVFATIKSKTFGYYEIRGDANGKLNVITLNGDSYLGLKQDKKSQFGHD